MQRVSEFAREKGISRSRAYALVRSGAIDSVQLDDGTILVEGVAAHYWKPRNARPLSERMAWALLSALDGEWDASLRGAEKSRLLGHIRDLRNDREPALALAEKVSKRAVLREYGVHKDDLADLRADPRLQVSGIGAPGSGMVAGEFVEGYVAPEHVDGLVSEYLLGSSSQGAGVSLRVSSLASVGRAAIAADLADWRGDRMLREANRIVADLLEEAE